MLKSLSIKNFRLFHELHIDALNRVNLIAGENDSGKTALLEALCLLFGDFHVFATLPSLLRSSFGIADASRGRTPFFPDEYESFWLWLISEKNVKQSLQVAAGAYSVNLIMHSVEDRTNQLEFAYLKDGKQIFQSQVSKSMGSQSSKGGADWPILSIFSTMPSSPIEDAEYFNRIAAKRNGEKRLVDLLRIIEPRLQDLKYLKLGSQPLVYADVGMEDLIPTTQLGQAFTRLLRLFSEILVAGSKIILIDEIENGIHYSAMPKVWKGIAAMARQEDLQIFATTHSYECIRYAHQAFSSEPVYDLALHRLERHDNGNVRAVTLDRESLATSFDLEWEIR
jgi:Predicted ATPases